MTAPALPVIYLTKGLRCACAETGSDVYYV